MGNFTDFTSACCDVNCGVRYNSDLCDPKTMSQFEDYLREWNKEVNQIKKLARSNAREEITHTDFLGNVLSVGDKVVFLKSAHRSFIKGTVLEMKRRTIILSHEKTELGRTKSIQHYDKIIRISS